MEIFKILLFFFLGSAIGSFLNVIILRLPAAVPITGRSACPSCRHVLSTFELVPLLSFLWLKGKCRHCHQSISPRYFLIELITAVCFAASFIILKPAGVLAYLNFFKDLFIVCIFIIVFVIDLEHYLILDSILFFGLGGVILFNLSLDVLASASPNPTHLFVQGIIGGLFTPLPFLLLWLISQGRWMGFGDVKLAIFLGVALTWPLSAVSLVLAVFLGAVVGVLLLVAKKKTLKSQLPFGTFLTLGGLLTIFYGQSLLTYYLSLLGF